AAPGALVQINHPRSDPYFGYFTLIDFDPAIATGRLTELASDFDLVEVWNGHGLDNGDAEVPVDVVLEDWLALLRAGRGAVATGNSDTHRLSRTPVGYPRTCARIADDGPDARRADAFVDALRVGDAFVTSGPFLDVTVEGEGLGRTVRARDGRVEVTVHAQAASWVPLDEVAVWLDGEEIERTRVTELPWSGGFDVPVTRDAFVIVVARGDEPLGVPAGAPLSPMRSFAFTNPVFVDADGDGMWTR
ncbi:MAG: CehA/McbA family metallohydrolase, partial [Deltaproteobacteria bacterium]|nr:CehA/McbA family metallohydrolase [Deltaproteobacteria bacterium]